MFEYTTFDLITRNLSTRCVEKMDNVRKYINNTEAFCDANNDFENAKKYIESLEKIKHIVDLALMQKDTLLKAANANDAKKQLSLLNDNRTGAIKIWKEKRYCASKGRDAVFIIVELKVSTASGVLVNTHYETILWNERKELNKIIERLIDRCRNVDKIVGNIPIDNDL